MCWDCGCQFKGKFGICVSAIKGHLGARWIYCVFVCQVAENTECTQFGIKSQNYSY